VIPIVEFPSVVTKVAPLFKDIFSSQEQFKHFQEYVSGLIVAERANIEGMNSLFLKRNDQSSLNKLLT